MPAHGLCHAETGCLNESPSEKEGKYVLRDGAVLVGLPLNESPSEKEGKYAVFKQSADKMHAPQ